MSDKRTELKEFIARALRANIPGFDSLNPVLQENIKLACIDCMIYQTDRDKGVAVESIERAGGRAHG